MRGTVQICRGKVTRNMKRINAGRRVKATKKKWVKHFFKDACKNGSLKWHYNGVEGNVS